MSSTITYPGPAGSGFDMIAAFSQSYGAVRKIVIQPTVIVFDFGGGDSTAYLGTGIGQNGGFPTSGTINIVEHRVAGVLVSVTSGLNKPADQILPFYLLGNPQGLMEFLYDGNDSFTGTSAGDTLLGLGGNDSLSGGLGNDLLDGGTGTDSIDGGGGNDTIRLDGNDHVRGGAGADTFEVMAGAPANGATIADFSASDIIVVGDRTFTQSDLTVVTGSGSTTLNIDSDQNGSADISLVLTGDFSGAGFTVSSGEGPGTSIVLGGSGGGSGGGPGLDGLNLIHDSAGAAYDDLWGTADGDGFVMTDDGVRDLIRDFDVGTDRIDVSAFAASLADLFIVNLTRKDGSISWVSVVDGTGDSEFLVRFDDAAATNAAALTADSFVFSDVPVVVPDTNTITDSSGYDDLYATLVDDVFIMQNDGQRDLVRDFDVGTDKLDVSAFAASMADLTISNLVRKDGSTSWVAIVDATGDSEFLIRFDGGTALDAGALSAADFIFA